MGTDQRGSGARATLAPLWFDLFNQVTLPFYWRGFEPERGSHGSRCVTQAVC